MPEWRRDGCRSRSCTVSESSRNEALGQALVVARLRAWRTALLAQHKTLVDNELARYAAAHGPVGGPHHALKLLSDDPWFQWLRPLIVLIVQIDERLAADAPISDVEFESFRRETRALLQSPPDTPLGREYQRSLQELPAAVVTHGKLLELLKADRPG
jgi:hypothetical protein